MDKDVTKKGKGNDTQTERTEIKKETLENKRQRERETHTIREI